MDRRAGQRGLPVPAGTARSANLTVSNTDVVWEPGSAARATGGAPDPITGEPTPTLFFTTVGNPTSTTVVNLLDSGDLYGEGMRIWDLKFAKNVRFANKRLNIGLDVFNLSNSDAATGYESDYTAFRLPDGTWVADNPATPDVEVQDWGRVSNVLTPRHMKLSVTFDF